jgi:hypothetical protein
MNYLPYFVIPYWSCFAMDYFPCYFPVKKCQLYNIPHPGYHQLQSIHSDMKTKILCKSSPSSWDCDKENTLFNSAIISQCTTTSKHNSSLFITQRILVFISDPNMTLPESTSLLTKLFCVF